MNEEEENGSSDQCPSTNTETPHHLYAELLAAAARVVDVGIPSILNVFVRAENARSKETPDAHKPVYYACVAGIIDFHLEHEEVEDKKDEASYRTNHH